ncbi:glycoside hydrolase family 65 protein [Conexibacter sp. SYSU D00693]|uniref:glycoside hydrolase family 65 protein n=1 Tax=Conexibacter sp. SYSU D00693 TaxID=2812560 RepID=UPI00196B92C4|nr:glycoside hydrolase family 65 protein [Conexibacter sp. SYSU D00693]
MSATRAQPGPPEDGAKPSGEGARPQRGGREEPAGGMGTAGRSDTLEPPEPWCLRETGVDRARLGRAESLFALSNGHLGLRGNLDEGEPRVVSGTYLNGFYESYPLDYGERGFGFAEDGQTVVNAPDGKIIRLVVENEPVDVERGTVEHHERELDLRAGVLRRQLRWRSAYGHRIEVRTKRMVSFLQRSVAAIQYEVEALDEPLWVTLQSILVANQDERSGGEDPRSARAIGDVLDPRLAVGGDRRAVLCHATKRTQLSVASGMDHVLDAPGDCRVSLDVEDDLARVTVSTRIEPGTPLRLTKFLAYHWSSRQTVEWLRDQVDASLEAALAEGWDGLADRQKRFLDDWWERADVELDGDPAVQQALRFALFHLIQAGARIEGRAIAAKGQTGTGYDGHAFWDTEAYVLPVLTYLEPRAVRDALEWRWSTLPQARERAAQLDLPGASLPWRTIHGEECSGYWPAGLAALHVNADVADAVRRYVHVTGDEEFERHQGFDLLVETARLWAGVGWFDRVGTFRINGVTGPDEYSALVDNNVFTNLMAKANLVAAAEVARKHADRAAELGVDEDEIATWERAAQAMYVPYDDALLVHPQDQDFTVHDVWDFAATPAEHYPLLLHYPYFQLYRRQVVKQADLVLALWFRGEAFTDEEKRRDFEYYEAITVRDSSLSACAQAVVAAEVGHLDLAWAYLREAALTDIDDLHHNAQGGLHMASLAGAVLSVTNGLGGFRDGDGIPRFRPRLPDPVRRVAFRLTIRGTRLRVELVPGEARYVVEDGEPLTIEHDGERFEVGADVVARPLPEVPDLDPPPFPAGRGPGCLGPAAD